MRMQNITPSKKEKADLTDAPKKCIRFILDYSKSYNVLKVGDAKIGLNLN